MESPIRIFVINLKSSVTRRESLQRRLDELNLTAEFIEAVNGHNLTGIEFAEHTLPVNYAYMKGEVGCALSHQLIYKKMVSGNIDTALILEDDVDLPDNLPAILSQIKLTAHLPEVTLLSRVNKFCKRNHRILTPDYTLHPVHQATTAHSYLITRQAAANLLAALYPIWMVADKWTLFEDYGWIKVNAIVPALVTLSAASSDSTINSQKGSEEVNNKKKALWEELMRKRPLRVKAKCRLRRALVPIIYGVTDQKKGP
jgi:glycosyl transferase family 25